MLFKKINTNSHFIQYSITIKYRDLQLIAIH